ncbi:hypothetical protein BDV3_005579 [Batrachochytrium dendrobatidis]
MPPSIADEHRENVLELDEYRDFVVDGFQPAIHASKMMISTTEDGQEVGMSEILGKLNYDIEYLGKKINEQVLRHYDSLLNQVSELNSVESTMNTVKQRFNTMQSSFNRIKTRLVDQHSQIKQCSTQIDHAQALNEVLRQVDHFLRLMTRLDTEIAAGPAEYAKTAIHIYELECILAESDLSGIEVVEMDLKKMSEFKTTIDTYANTLLHDGLTEQNQAKVAEGLQIFSNMHTMPAKVADLINRITTTIVQEIHKTFDVISLNAEMKEIQQRSSTTGGVRRVNEPPVASSSSNVATWANILWTRTEKLTDVIYTLSVQLYLLDNLLKRKWDPVTRISFQEEVVQLIGGDIPFVFWTNIAQLLDKEIKIVTKGSQFLLQVLQAGYPRFLRVFHDVFTRISLVSGNTFNGVDKSFESQTVLRILSSFESAYVSRSLTRLLDVVNSVFPDKPVPGQRASASRDDVDKIMRTVSSELDVVKFDGNLLRMASKNILKALHMYTVKCENLSPTDTSAYQIGISISSSQQLNVDILNCLSHASDSIWRLLDDYEDTTAAVSLTDAVTTTTKLIQGIIEPLLMSFACELEAVIAKMHKEDYSSTQPARVVAPRQSDTTSAYIPELVTHLKWIAREILGRLQCGDDTREWANSLSTRTVELLMRHVSLVRPLNELGKLRIAADLTQIEYVLNQFLGTYDIKLDVDLVETHRSMRAFRHLLFMDQNELANAHQLTHLSPIIVLHHIIVRSNGAIPLPMQVRGWSPSEYSTWLDNHSLAQTLSLLEKSLLVYVSEVSRRGETQYCIECPILRSLLTIYAKQHQ